MVLRGLTVPGGGGGGGGAPDPHAASHENGGTDEITVAGLSGVLADPQTPAAHAASHENGGADEIGVAGLSGLLADDQTPATHDILTKHNGFPGGGTTFLRDDGTFAAPPGGGGGDSITVNGVAVVDADFDDATPAPPAGEVNVKWQKDAGSPANVSASVQAATTAVKGVVELATDGESAANVVVQGNDARMSNARNPTAHAASHQSGGSDAIKLDDLAAPDDNTDLNASITKHGLLVKLDGGTTVFLRGDGTWAAPTATASDPSYSPGSFTVATETSRTSSRRIKLTGSQRATIEGTGCLRIT